MSDHPDLSYIRKAFAAALGSFDTETETTAADVESAVANTLQKITDSGLIQAGGEVKVTSFDSLDERIQHRILWKWLELRLAVYDAALRFPLDGPLVAFMGPDARWLIQERVVSPNGIIPAEDDDESYTVLADPGHPKYRYLTDVEIVPSLPLNSIHVEFTIGDEE